MVIERFRRSGRMLPDGVISQASWIDPAGARCFQVMEAPGPEALNLWVSRWDDLVDFEIVPVLTSSEFWSPEAPDSRRRRDRRPSAIRGQ